MDSNNHPHNTSVGMIKFGAGLAMRRMIPTLMQAMILLNLSLSPALAENIPTYPDLRAAIEAAYQARSDLLQHSTGVSKLSIKNAGTPEAIQAMKNRFSNVLGRESKAVLAGKGDWTATWYKKGVKKRYDVYVPPPEEKSLTRRSFFTPTNKRIAVDSEKGIYYDVLHQEAYINRPPSKITNPYSLFNHFDVNRLYQFLCVDVPVLLEDTEKMEEAGGQFKITEEQIGQMRCIKLDYNREWVKKGISRKQILEMWFAPEMSYSLVKARFFGNGRTRGKELMLLESYDATYEESDDHPGIWLLKDLTIVDNQWFNMSETLKATFENVKIGVDIPDETFTFEGLGVPPGTTLYDKSLRGQPLKYHYKSFPIGKVDDLSEEILAQQEEKDKGKSGIAVAEGAVKNILPEQEEIEPDPAGRTVAQIQNGVNYLWILYGVVAITIGAILVAVYRRYLTWPKKERS